jgi:hypothetical protein
VGTIREALISVDELGVYQSAREAGALRVRARPLIRVPNDIGADAAIALACDLTRRGRLRWSSCL